SPLFRHQGLFKALYGGLEASLCRSGARSVLLVCAARSPASRSIASRLDAKLDHAELRMRLDPDGLERVEPPADLRLVPVGEDDADDCSRLAATIFGDSYDDERAFVEAVLRDEARELFMAHGADGAVGMATITRGEAGYELNGVGVLPEHRGKGYGSAIMDACLVVLRKRGVRDVSLEVDAANESALALYRSRGFAETTRVDYWRLPTRCS
ncbi:MAG TPA: GNAT family N-acetyltransferase, partial [Spirochaetales bacterium]|nr:GNAT family N-acetyltransferase [Spirochaetales bacterium]